MRFFQDAVILQVTKQMPIPDDMPREARPAEGKPRGRCSYTVYSDVNSASMEVLLSQKATAI